MDSNSSGIAPPESSTLPVELRTLDYLFDAQRVLTTTGTSKLNTPSSAELSAGRQQIAAYLRWHLNSRLEQCAEAIGIAAGGNSKKFGNSRKEKRRELTELCNNCGSRLSHFRLVPKKLLDRKRKKKGRNFEVNLLNGRCGQCRSTFQFNGLKKELPNCSKLANSKRKGSIKFNVNQHSNSSSFNISARSSLPAASRNSTVSKGDKSSITSSTPTSAKKEALQRMLSDSKRQRSLDSKTRLSDFLSSCFNK